MKLFNSLTREKEEFKPIGERVGVYACGPTVYSYLTIGNWRTYVLGDVLVRSLKYFGYDLDYVMNITDVGHLTGDNLGDADMGEDRLEKAAASEGKTAWDIAKFYTDDFLKGYELLGLSKPKAFTKATEYIEEQVELVQKIEEKGFTYKISDGVYFDTVAFEKAGFEYGELSNIDQVKEGARCEPNTQKKNPRDFALWKFCEAKEKRHMEWDSPWGRGFPGWHIECSAMSMKHLGEQFDIHLGGEDLKSTHHPNEIAQAEAATGKHPFVKYWIHGAFLQVDGGRMGKSLGNAYTLTDVIERGFGPMDLRYFYFSGHYRRQLNFTWEGLESAKRALSKLKTNVQKLKSEVQNENVGEVSVDGLEHKGRFEQALEDDMNVPEALGVLWEVVRDSELTVGEKLGLALDFDRVFGLGLDEVENVLDVTDDVELLVKQREKFRLEKKFDKADEVRDKLKELGYEVEDTVDGSKVRSILG